MNVAVMLVLAGCAEGASQGELQNCREFTAQVTVEGQLRQAVGQACQQPDGSWQVALNTPGFPQQVYTLPGQAINLYPYPEPYYWWDPAFYGPLFFAGGPVFFAHGFHHFHHHGFQHHGGFHHGGFHGGRR